ncbi:MAG TPA: M20 family metallopeptidase [Candidatus Dormibacteraeota bacterium]|jgi:acetylornithine deacetylase/succinyl-diaminopimelate desuccinylase family protein
MSGVLAIAGPEAQRVGAHLSPARTAAILADLVRARSQNPMDGEAAVADYITEFLRRVGLEVTSPEVLPGRPNVVGRLRGSGGGPVVAFNTHMDTVPEGNGWTRAPFEGEVIDGRLYGRGAADAKGPLAAFLAAIEALAGSAVQLRGDLVMTAVVDEETGSRGARALVPALEVDMAVVGEPTSMDVGIAHRGSLRPVLAVNGRTAHSSRPDQGVNAIYQSVPVVEAFRSYADRIRGRTHPLCGSPSAAITMMSAGVAENVIPGLCELTLDRRMIPGEVEAEVVAEIEQVLADVRAERPDVDVRIARMLATTGGASELDPDHPLVVLALASAHAATGRQASVIGLSGACDMTHFRAHGVPCVVLGPGDSAQAHQPDESIDIRELHQGALAYSLVALEACGHG